MSTHYFNKAVSALKENYVSAIIGLIIFLIAFNYIADYLKLNEKISLDSLLGNKQEENIEEQGVPRGYIVKEGDTLWSISESQIGSGYNFVDIARVNNLINVNDIKAGQELIIPDVSPIVPGEEIAEESISETKSDENQKEIEPTEETKISAETYTVVKGDTLWDIAVRSYGDGYMWISIAQANKLVNPDVIHPGNIFVLPRN